MHDFAESKKESLALLGPCQDTVLKVIISEAVVCGVVELYCSTQRGTAVIYPTLAELKRVDRKLYSIANRSL